MNRTIKFLVVALCALLCGGGAMVSSKGHSPKWKSKVLPIDNRAKPAKIRLWA